MPNTLDTSVVEPRPKYAVYFDMAITVGIGLLAIALVKNTHGIQQKLDRLIELSENAHADAMRELEEDIEYRAGDATAEDE